jgi:hypothetical protein
MTKTIFLSGIITMFCFLVASSQEQNMRAHSVNVFIDCDFCDMDHIRREVTWVNYMREHKEADVHILITTENTGSGGKKVSLFFIGQKRFNGMNDTITFGSLPDDTDDAIRQKLIQSIKSGLFQFIKKTPLADHIVFDVILPEQAEEVTDKWNNWVFSLSLSGYANGNKNYNQFNLWSSVSANKITEKFKSETTFSNSYSETKYDYDSYKYTSLNRSWSFYHQDVFSITDHWSAGFWAGMNSSTYSNLQLSYYVNPAIEYSLFPYRESTRKQLRINYSVGPSQRHYIDTTIYNITDELLWKHNINLAAEFVQPWGRIWLYSSYSNYIHDFSLNRLSFNASLSLRLFKGLEFYLYSGYSIIHDQIGLPKGDATQEELLLQQRELKTDYSFWANAGLTYTFGNLYNNVVNPRFGN